MIEIKIQKIGDFLGIILPNEVLTHLNCGEGGTVIMVQTPNGGYTLMRYDDALRELAKY